MAKADRVLTIEEIMNGNISKEYIDRKEKKAILERRIRKLCDQRFDLEDKISIIGKREYLVKELEGLNKKIEKAEEEYACV